MKSEKPTYICPHINYFCWPNNFCVFTTCVLPWSRRGFKQTGGKLPNFEVANRALYHPIFCSKKKRRELPLFLPCHDTYFDTQTTCCFSCWKIIWVFCNAWWNVSDFSRNHNSYSWTGPQSWPQMHSDYDLEGRTWVWKSSKFSFSWFRFLGSGEFEVRPVKFEVVRSSLHILYGFDPILLRLV